MCIGSEALTFHATLISHATSRPATDGWNRGRLVGGGQVTMMFEPFILSMECRTLEDATRLNIVAHEAGFRESGYASCNQAA
eukprot:260109-Pyramimonas_sp.AAC.2